MKINHITILLLSIVLLSCNPKEEKFEIKRGLNVSHWLSQTKKRGAERAAYMQEKDFEAIAKAGFDHVRIPFEEEQLWDEQGNKHKDAFALLHQGIKWAFKHNLKVIADLHIVRSHHFVGDNQRLWDDPEAQEKFFSFWEQLSKELHKYPNDKLAYELLNEAVADNADDWNKLIAKSIARVRTFEPERTIVVGSNKWQGVGTFPELKVPANDKNLLLSFHFYDPFVITHHQASWAGTLGKYKGALNYPGKPVAEADLIGYPEDVQEKINSMNKISNREEMKKAIMIAKNVADSLGLPLFCGEFGCLPKSDIKVRKAIYQDWISIFNELDIAWCHWNYKNDFPVFDPETLEPMSDFTDILLSPSSK